MEIEEENGIVLPPNIKLPTPFTVLPEYRVSLIVRNHLKNIIQIIIGFMRESWIDKQRINYTRLLRTAIIFGQDSLINYPLNEIYEMLIRCRNDDRPEVKETAIECSMYLGCFIPTDKLLDVILPYV